MVGKHYIIEVDSYVCISMVKMGVLYVQTYKAIKIDFKQYFVIAAGRLYNPELAYFAPTAAAALFLYFYRLNYFIGCVASTFNSVYSKFLF